MAKAVKSRKFDTKVKPLTSLKAWKDLKAHAREVAKLHMRSLFADDPKRGERLTAEGVGLFLDYSKNRVTDETMKLLLGLVDAMELLVGFLRSVRGSDACQPPKRLCPAPAAPAPPAREPPPAPPPNRAARPEPDPTEIDCARIAPPDVFSPTMVTVSPG